MSTKKSKSAILEERINELEQSRARLAADYQNLSRRMEEQRSEIYQLATAQVLEKLFPVIDNFYRAAEHQPNLSADALASEESIKKFTSYIAGLNMLEKQLMQTVNELGLTKIETKGAMFDANLHEAISYENNADVPEDYIIAEVEAGWCISGKVIKPAKVRVSKGK